TPDNPGRGIFVFRRLESMASKARLHVLQPIPYFPGIRPLPDWANIASRVGNLRIEHTPMFYLPRLFKSLDSCWLYRSVFRRLRTLNRPGESLVVDAHFGYPDGAGCVRAAGELGIPAFITVRG